MNADKPFLTWDYDSLMHFQPTLFPIEIRDSTFLSSTESQVGTSASHLLYDSNSIILFFFITFSFIAIAFLQRRSFLMALFNNVFRLKRRSAAYVETNLSDLHTNVQLLPQTTLIFSLLCFYSINGGYMAMSEGKTALILFLFSISFALFYTLKFLFFRLLGYLFFDNISSIMWRDSYLSNLSLIGIVLWPLILISIYSNLYSNLLLILFGGLFLFLEPCKYIRCLLFLFHNLTHCFI